MSIPPIYGAIRSNPGDGDGDWLDLGTVAYRPEAAKAAVERKLGQETYVYRNDHPVRRIGKFKVTEETS